MKPKGLKAPTKQKAVKRMGKPPMPGMSKMPELPKMYSGSKKKPEQDNKPKMPAMKQGPQKSLRKRLAGRAL